MLRKIMLGTVLAGSLMVGSNVANAAAFDWYQFTRNGTNTADTTTSLPTHTLAPQFAVINPATQLPENVVIGDDFFVDWGFNTMHVGQITQSHVDNLVSDLAGKADSSSVSSLSSGVSFLSGLVSTLSAQVSALGTTTNALASSSMQRIRVQTNTSGTYTWTFPVAYGSTTVPVVSATPEDATAGASTDVRITSISNTSVTVQTSRITTVLGLLSLNATPQIYVHLTAIAP